MAVLNVKFLVLALTGIATFNIYTVQMTENNIEVGLVGADRKFKVELLMMIVALWLYLASPFSI